MGPFKYWHPLGLTAAYQAVGLEGAARPGWRPTIGCCSETTPTDAMTLRRNWPVGLRAQAARKLREKVAEFYLSRILAFSGSSTFDQNFLPPSSPLPPSLSHRAFAFNDSLAPPPTLSPRSSLAPPCLSLALLSAPRHGELAIIYLWQRIVCARGLK